MMECVDGDYQTFKSKDGAYVREHFFNTPELKAMVANWSDDDIWRLNRGGHDPHKVYAAYAAAVEPYRPADRDPAPRPSRATAWANRARRRTSPTSRRRWAPPRSRPSATASSCRSATSNWKTLPYLKFAEGSPELKYMREHRLALGGYLPQAPAHASNRMPVPPLSAFDALLKATGEGREILDHHGLRAHPQRPAQGQGDRQAHRADRARRIAHLRHGRHVPPDRHLEPAGPDTTCRRTPTS